MNLTINISIKIYADLKIKILQTLSAAILATSTTVSADWNMPFFGDNNNSNSNVNNSGSGATDGVVADRVQIGIVNVCFVKLITFSTFYIKRK